MYKKKGDPDPEYVEEKREEVVVEEVFEHRHEEEIKEERHERTERPEREERPDRRRERRGRDGEEVEEVVEEEEVKGLTYQEFKA